MRNREKQPKQKRASAGASYAALLQENKELLAQLNEAKETLQAIHRGEIDAVVVSQPQGQKVFTLQSADYSYRVLIEAMQEGALTVTTSGTILYCNKQFAKLINKPIEKVIGSFIFDYIAAVDMLAFHKLFRRGTKKTSQGELHLKSDSPIPVYISITTLKKTYDIPALSIVVTDLTEQKRTAQVQALVDRLEEQSRTFEAVLTNSQDLITLHDKQKRFVYINRAVETILNLNREKVIGKKIAEVKLPKELMANFEHALQEALSTGNSVRGEFCYQISKKENRYYEYLLTPVKHHKTIQAVVGITRDISKRKLLEQQKDEFLGVASHELKTPVTSIKAYAQVLQKAFRNKGDDRSAEQLQKMDNQVNKLAKLITDLLDVTKIQAGKMQFEHRYFDFNELVQEIVAEMQRTTQTHTIKVFLSKSVQVCGDRDRIGQVLINLLSNAIKYSPQAKKVIVKTTLNKNTIATSVQDFGVGISPHAHAHIFERFFRVRDEKHQTFPGLGLGLYISAQIINTHGGQITVKSEENTGSTFSFTLPIG